MTVDGDWRTRPVLYLAGPYTRPDPVVNTHAACKVGTIIAEQTGWAPMVPHITLLWHAISPQPITFWYDLDLCYIAKCDAVVRLPGLSTGADAELDFAAERHITIIEYSTLPDAARRVWEDR